MLLDHNISRHFLKKDSNKHKRQVYQKNKSYKSNKSQNRYDKFYEAHVTRLEEPKTGLMYETGVAVKAAKN